MKDLIFNPKRPGLCILSFGAGQDSTAILYRLILDSQFRSQKLAGRNLVVVFSDTGNERSDVYDHLWWTLTLCESYGIKLVHLASTDVVLMHQETGRSTSHILTGFHSESWKSLQGQYDRNHNLAIRRNKSCTDNLKIKPIYRWLDWFCSCLLGSESRDHRGKKGIIAYASAHGKIEMMIGFSKGEESRAEKLSKVQPQKWWQSIQKTAPLIDLGMTRMDCISYMESSPWVACGPSMCKMCPNISKQTLVLMWLKDRRSFIAWCRHERRKLRKWSESPRNLGALGSTKTLIQELREAIVELDGWSIEDLERHQFTHGHCISSGY